MADQSVSINFSSDVDKSIQANNALIASLKAVEAQYKSVQATFKGGSSRVSAGNFDTRNQRVTTPNQSSTGSGGGANGGLQDIDRLSAALAGFQQRARTPIQIPLNTSVAQNEVSSLGSSIAGLAAQAAAFTGLTVGMAALGNEIRKAVMAVADLDYAMSAVASVGGLDKTSAEFQRLTGVVVEMGAATRYTSAEAADGLKELVAAGYKTTDATKILGDTLNLASTENMSLVRASEIVVAGMQAMGLSVSESTNFVDTLARAANASTASIDDMGEALKYVAPVAKAMNIPLDETSALLAILANNGIRGGMAGRGLTSVMVKLAGPTKDAVEALRAVGVSASEINPQIVGVENSLNKLATLDIPTLSKLFGVENIDISSILGRNAASFDGMKQAMNDANIAAKKMAETRMDNLTGDLDELGAAFDALRIALASDFYEKFRGDIEDFTKYLNDNRDAIVENIREVGNIALVLAQVVIAYKAVQAASLIGHLVASAARWAFETKMVQANTTALTTNASARLKAIGGNVGTVAGAAIGMEIAPEDASGLETTAYVIGAMVVANAIGKGIAAGLGKAFTSFGGPALLKNAGYWASGARIVMAKELASVPVQIRLATRTPIAAAAAYAITQFDKLASEKFEGADTVNETGNQMTSNATRNIAEAKDGVALAKAQKQLQADILAIEKLRYQAQKDVNAGSTLFEKLALIGKQKPNEAQLENLKATEAYLNRLLDKSVELNAKRQAQLRTEQEIKDHNANALAIEEMRVKMSAQIAQNLKLQAEAAKEFNAAYGQRLDVAIGGLSDADALDAQGKKFSEARDKVAGIRKELDAAAKFAVSPQSELGSDLTKDLAKDKRVKPNSPSTDGKSFMDVVNSDPKLAEAKSAVDRLTPSKLQLTFDKDEALTDVESVAKYYHKVLEEAKKSGNVKLQATVEPFLKQLDEAVKASIEAGNKIRQALEQRDIRVNILLPEGQRMSIASADDDSAIKDANETRKKIDEILSQNGIKPLIDPSVELKNAEDIAAYYAKVAEELKKRGLSDILTQKPFNDLISLLDKVGAANKKYDDALKEKESKDSQMREIEILEAKEKSGKFPWEDALTRAAQNLNKAGGSLQSAAGLQAAAGLDAAPSLNGQNDVASVASRLNANPSLAFTEGDGKGIQNEIAKEQAAIAAAMKLTGKEGQAQARELAKRKVSANLGISLNEKNEEMNPLAGKPRQLGSGATAMNQLFGRSSNSGLLEAAKEQNGYLKTLVELAKIKESIKYVATVA